MYAKRRELTQHASKMSRRRSVLRTLRLESLDNRQLMAVDVVDDTFNLSQGAALNVLTNDSTGTEVQTVSATNLDYDPATVDKAANLADWFVPNRPGTTVPQRSLIPRALVEEPPQSNFGDVDLWLDIGGTIDTTDDIEMTRTEGIVLSVVRENIIPSAGASSVNLSVVSYNTEGTGNAWLSTVAAPQNDNESQARLAGALFPYAANWQGGSFNATGGANNVPATAGITATQVGTGRYEISVTGVNDSFNDGYLFAISAQNSDNYSHTMPMGGNKWLLAHRDNSAAFTGGEDGAFNVLYIPRSAQGLIGGHVNGGTTTPNALFSSFGDFSVQRESNGFWRMSVPGHSPTSGVLILETNEASRGAPGNVYLSYEADGDDFIIRQLEGNTMNPINDDFVAFFVPFENSLQTATTLDVTTLGTAAAPSSGLSELGIALTLNADGTVNYDSDSAMRALAEGQTAVDTFIYSATDGVETATGSVTVNWVGANDAPTVTGSIPSQTFNEDAAAVTFNLATLFADVDTGDILTYSIDPGIGGILDASISGSILTIGPAADRFGFTYFRVTATDTFGASATIQVATTVFAQTDTPRAVADTAITNNVSPINIDVIANDFHPDTSEFSVAAAAISADPAATTNATSIYTVVDSSPAPNQLTIQSAGNVGDVAVGRNGSNLSFADGVLIGTAANNVSPYQTVTTYDAFSSYGFSTNTGVGAGERNSPINAGFFPFQDGWVSGHVAADGTLLGGVGVTQASIIKVETGLYEVRIPGMNSMGAFFDSGLFLATANVNDDKVISVNPRFGANAGWQVRVVDSDSDGSDFFNPGEEQGWSFVYIPSTAPGLKGGHVLNDGSFLLGRQYGGVTAVSQSGGLTVTVPGYTPADGVIVAISADDTVLTNTNFETKTVPSSRQVVATPTADGLAFRLEAFNTGTYGAAEDQFYFVFLPYDQPQELLPNLNLSITAVSGTSARGATVTLNPDGTINYNPTTGNSSISGLQPGQTVSDTFTYTLADQRTPRGTATGTVTVTVSGQNQAPTANADVINSNELNVNGARLTVLRNDLDADIAAIFGTPVGIPAANLSVDSSGVWSVAQSSPAANAVTLGATATGSVELLNAGAPVTRAGGVVLATVRENAESPSSNFRFVQSYENGTGGTSLAIGQFGVDAAANAQVSVSYFRFDDNWIGGHVDSLGGLLAGGGLTAANVVRTGVGSYEVSIPGVIDAGLDGFLYAIGNENADNVVSTHPVAGTNRYVVAVRDNQQDAADREDGGFSFVFVPRTAQSLVAGTVDANSASPNPITQGVGEFTLVRQTVATGGNEWKLTIPGQSPDSGMLLLTNLNPTSPEDNYLTYASDGAGSFLIRSHDLPNLGRQNAPFTFTFVPFDVASQPVFRPTPDVLSISSVDATSSLGATLSINSDGTITYSPGTILDSLYDGDAVVDTFQYTMTDGFGGSSSASVTLNIAGVGQPVALSFSSGTTYYAIGDSAIAIDTVAALSNPLQPFLNGAVVTVSIDSGIAVGDLLTIRNDGTGANQVGLSGSDVTFGGVTVGTLAGGSNGEALTVTFNANATIAAAQAVLRNVSFGNLNANGSLDQRVIEAQYVDGNGRFAPATSKTINVGLLRRRTLQQNTDQGYGLYAGVSDIELSQITPDTPQPTGRVAADGLLVDRRDTGGTNETHVVLKFADIFGTSTGQIPSDAIITSAKLILDTNNSGHGASMHRLLQDINPNSATWNSTVGGIQADGVEAMSTWQSQFGVVNNQGTTGAGLTSVSVLPDLLAWQSGAANFGWAMLPWNGGTDGWGFTASETATVADRPKLEIEWLPAGTQVASFRQGVNGYASAKDTILRENLPDTTAEADLNLFVDFKDATATNANHVLIRFDDIIGSTLGQIPAGSTIVSAQLRLASLIGNAPGDGGTFHAMLNSWNDTDTWNSLAGGITADGVEAASIPTTSAGLPTRDPNVQGGFNAFNVTSDVQAWVNGSQANQGWAVLPWNLGTDGWAIQSSESVLESDRPMLSVYFIPGTGDTVPPDAPAITLNEDTGTQGDSVTSNGSYTVTPAEPGGTIEYRFNGGDWSTTAPTATEGQNVIDVRHTDDAGNTSPVSSLSFTLDTVSPVSPTIVLTNDTGTPADSITNNGAYTVTPAEAAGVIEYSIDGTTWSTTAPTAVEGLNTISVRQTDNAGNVGAIGVLNFMLDTQAATVTNVYIAGSNWNTAFVNSLSSSGFGLELLTGMQPIATTGVNRITVQFSEDVIGLSSSTIEVRDSNGVLPFTISYSPTTFRAVVTLNAGLSFAKIRLALSDLIVDVAGNLLDGDNAGGAGGLYNRRFDVLAGDVTGDGRVNGVDLPPFSTSFNQQIGQANYNRRANFNGDERVNGVDLPIFSAAFNRSLTTLGEPGAPFGGSGASFGSLVDDFFDGFGDDEDDDEEGLFGGL